MLVLAAVANVTSAAGAVGHATFLNAPALPGPRAAKAAAQFQLNVSLPEGRGLARALLDAGVKQQDASDAARLATGHLGLGAGGCHAKISIERSLEGQGFDLVRVQLTTGERQTVIERRGSALTIASDVAAPSGLRLI